MISLHIRRMAVALNLQTGKSVKEILEEIVRAVTSGVVDFKSKTCPLCGGCQSVTTSTRSSPDFVLRFHKCTFCGVTFRSHETKKDPKPERKSVQITSEIEKPIVKKRRKK